MFSYVRLVTNMFVGIRWVPALECLEVHQTSALNPFSVQPCVGRIDGKGEGSGFLVWKRYRWPDDKGRMLWEGEGNTEKVERDSVGRRVKDQWTENLRGLEETTKKERLGCRGRGWSEGVYVVTKRDPRKRK